MSKHEFGALTIIPIHFSLRKNFVFISSLSAGTFKWRTVHVQVKMSAAQDQMMLKPPRWSGPLCHGTRSLRSKVGVEELLIAMS
jgi:hypothetical protein